MSKKALDNRVTKLPVRARNEDQESDQRSEACKLQLSKLLSFYKITYREFKDLRHAKVVLKAREAETESFTITIRHATYNATIQSTFPAIGRLQQCFLIRFSIQKKVIAASGNVHDNAIIFKINQCHWLVAEHDFLAFTLALMNYFVSRFNKKALKVLVPKQDKIPQYVGEFFTSYQFQELEMGDFRQYTALTERRVKKIVELV